jgi:hypothetical protein
MHYLLQLVKSRVMVNEGPPYSTGLKWLNGEIGEYTLQSQQRTADESYRGTADTVCQICDTNMVQRRMRKAAEGS